MIHDFINQLEKKEDLDFHSMQSAIESIIEDVTFKSLGKTELSMMRL